MTPRDALALDVGRAVLDALGYGVPGRGMADARLLERAVEDYATRKPAMVFASQVVGAVARVLREHGVTRAET